jgi:hypothetical protein
MVTIADTPEIMSDWNEIEYGAVSNTDFTDTDYLMSIGLITYDSEDFCANVYDGTEEDCATYIEDADLAFDENDHTGNLVVTYMYQSEVTFPSAGFGGCIEETGQCWGYAFVYNSGFTKYATSFLMEIGTIDADTPTFYVALESASIISDDIYVTDEGLYLAMNDEIWVEDQFASDAGEGVFFSAWIYTEDAAETNDTVTLINDQEVTVWSWAVVAEDVSNEEN